MKRLIRTYKPLSTLTTATLFAALLAQDMNAQAIYRENFEELNLGPNVEEGLAGDKVWTKTPPAGWSTDDSKMPGFGDPSKNGITEWAGWSFANKNWWVRAAGDQRRSEFVYGSGNVMIADPDEWDDASHAQGLFESIITSNEVGITNSAAGSLVLVYDSSWRPEALDDGEPSFPVDAEGNRINDQTGFISLSFDGGAPIEIQRWDSISDSPNYHDHNPNESVIIPINNPAGAKNLTLKFGMEKAANDWWWAVDNIAIGVPPFANGINANGVGFTVRIVQALGKLVDQSKGIVLELDGNAAAPVAVGQDGDFITAGYSQTPVFAPGSRHTVKVKFTSDSGVVIQDTLEFTAPTYVTASATPASVLASITEAEWMKIDESKGVKVTLDGANVTGVTVSRTDSVVNARFTQSSLFAPKSAHTIAVTFTTTLGQELVETVAFTAPDYPTLPASLATAVGTGSQPGMRWRTYQIEGSGPSNIAEAEAQLAGSRGADIHITDGQNPDGFFPIDFVNFEQTASEAGNFKSSAEAPQNVDDLPVPGIDIGGATDHIVGEARAFVEFTQPGVYTMVVNSDDGFQLSAGTTNSPGQVTLGKFDATRGSSDTTVYFKVDQAGVYFFRLLWFENGGGASVEWFTQNSNGGRALVGGTQPGALKAYRVRTVAEPAGSTTTGGIFSFTKENNNLVINYDGVLHSANDISGPFQPVTGATKPYNAPLDGSKRYFIAR